MDIQIGEDAAALLAKFQKKLAREMAEKIEEFEEQLDLYIENLLERVATDIILSAIGFKKNQWGEIEFTGAGNSPLRLAIEKAAGKVVDEQIIPKFSSYKPTASNLKMLRDHLAWCVEQSAEGRLELLAERIVDKVVEDIESGS